MAKINDSNAVIEYEEKGEDCKIDIERIRKVTKSCGISFDDGYIERVLRKYYTRKA